MQIEAIARLRDQVQAVGGDFQSRFGPAVDGLAHVVAGGRFDASGVASGPDGGRRFLGWSVGPHWLLTAAAPSYAADGPPAGT